MMGGNGSGRERRWYTRLQTVWSLPGHSRQVNKGQSSRCHLRPNGPGRLADRSSNLPHSLQRGVRYGTKGRWLGYVKSTAINERGVVAGRAMTKRCAGDTSESTVVVAVAVAVAMTATVTVV